jgi:hypothetical protein
MKISLILLTLSTLAFGRQYIQCAHSNSWDRMVINLDGEASTLFLTTGVHDPNELRVLKDLYLQSEGDDFTVYETRDGAVKEEVEIENQYLNRALGYFPVTFTMTKVDTGYSQTFELGCFSSIH